MGSCRQALCSQGGYRLRVQRNGSRERLELERALPEKRMVGQNFTAALNVNAHHSWQWDRTPFHCLRRIGPS